MELRYKTQDWGWSVLVGEYWLDVWIDKEDILVEWNQYIFDLKNDKDVERRDFQDNVDNFMEYSSLAVQHLEECNQVYQDYKARWYVSPDNVQDSICLKEGDIISFNASAPNYSAKKGAKARVVEDFHRKDEYVVIEWIDDLSNEQCNGKYYINMFDY